MVIVYLSLCQLNPHRLFVPLVVCVCSLTMHALSTYVWCTCCTGRWDETKRWLTSSGTWPRHITRLQWLQWMIVRGEAMCLSPRDELMAPNYNVALCSLLTNRLHQCYYLFIKHLQVANQTDISQSDSLSDNKSSGQQMVVQHLQDFFHLFLGSLCILENNIFI